MTQPVEIVQCAVLDPSLKRRVGERIPLQLHKARVMEKRGTVKILDPEDPQSAVAVSLDPKKTATASPYPAFNRTEFKRYSPWPRIAWVQDFTKLGGAEMSNLHVIKIGELLGFDIVGVTPNTFRPEVLRAAEVVVINNVFEFDEKQLHAIYWELFEYKKRFIKYDHDMRELRRLSKTRCLFERSAMNVFISPAHASAYKKEHIDGVELPLAVDTEFWRSTGAQRIPKTAIIPTYHKGPENHDKYIREHQDWQFTVLGNRFPSAQKNIKLLNKQTPEKMRELFSTHETMVHLPSTLWAGDRVLFEAELCGCKVEANDNVGHKSWGAIDRAAIARAPYKFWEIVEDLL